MVHVPRRIRVLVRQLYALLPAVCSSPCTYTIYSLPAQIANVTLTDGLGLNNGTCTAPGVCTCTSQYSAICQNPCLNGGTCSAPATCTCLSGYNGSQCQT
ncbi:unnamed protein product, partial [Didymodactylos carnosus]